MTEYGICRDNTGNPSYPHSRKLRLRNPMTDFCYIDKKCISKIPNNCLKSVKSTQLKYACEKGEKVNKCIYTNEHIPYK